MQKNPKENAKHPELCYRTAVLTRLCISEQSCSLYCRNHQVTKVRKVLIAISTETSECRFFLFPFFPQTWIQSCEITCACECTSPGVGWGGVRTSCALWCVLLVHFFVSLSHSERARALQDRHGGVGVSIMINRPTRQLSHAITLHHGSQGLKVKTNGSSSTWGLHISSFFFSSLYCAFILGEKDLSLFPLKPPFVICGCVCTCLWVCALYVHAHTYLDLQTVWA